MLPAAELYAIQLQVTEPYMMVQTRAAVTAYRRLLGIGVGLLFVMRALAVS